MKQIFAILALVLLAIGAAALYLIPVFWQPEPVLVFRVGIGAGIFSVLFALAVLIQLLAISFDWGKEKLVDKITREREESHRQFLRRLDHELKNPLTGLQAALTNLREAQSAADTQAAVDNASQAATRLGRILRDLRKLSELDTQMLEHRPVNVSELVNEMVGAANGLPAYRGRSINLLVSKVPALPPVAGDRDMLGLAVYNLLDNALKYSGSADAVEVRVREDGRALFIEVADGGAGIPAQEQQRIFDDIYRGENARETEGSGLGLALARRIVQLHGGEIFLRSDPAQGRGTVFTIRLPV
ncbi:MAG TPA: sensor histidine kinase [Anaerolineae bacterium]|nr:sensor histidine kinase [Anaerolineae bacterium]